jgi:hypothetical protein
MSDRERGDFERIPSCAGELDRDARTQKADGSMYGFSSLETPS